MNLILCLCACVNVYCVCIYYNIYINVLKAVEPKVLTFMNSFFRVIELYLLTLDGSLFCVALVVSEL